MRIHQDTPVSTEGRVKSILMISVRTAVQQQKQKKKWLGIYQDLEKEIELEKLLKVTAAGVERPS